MGSSVSVDSVVEVSIGTYDGSWQRSESFNFACTPDGGSESQGGSIVIEAHPSGSGGRSAADTDGAVQSNASDVAMMRSPASSVARTRCSTALTRAPIGNKKLLLN